ncbi:DUF2809 domain-containing protein [uncultured Nostoc sp.]|uniref:ribosomal maturation YjgA family protein n=1 Tax=uncultured Nostoc sp. TaxID=340711 RepID=UPI0035CB9716
MSKLTLTRILTIISIIVVIPMGLFSKQYTGFAQEWIHNNAGDIFYQIFWCLFVFLFMSTEFAANRIPIFIFFFGCLIEFTQAWHTPFLDLIRSHILGKLLLGTAFDWREFPTYAIGSFIGWLWLCLILSFSQINHDSSHG